MAPLNKRYQPSFQQSGGFVSTALRLITSVKVVLDL